VLWICLYYMFLIISLILMINLLIAMMSNTITEVLDETTLLSRLSFATHMMKLELMASSSLVCMSTRCGKLNAQGTQYVYEFKAFDRSVDAADDGESDDGYEGDFAEGGSDPFAPPVHSQTARIEMLVRELKEDVAEVKEHQERHHEHQAPQSIRRKSSQRSIAMRRRSSRTEMHSGAPMVPRRGFDEPSLTNRRSFDEVARVASRQRASLEAAQFGGSSRWALARAALRQMGFSHISHSSQEESLARAHPPALIPVAQAVQLLRRLGSRRSHSSSRRSDVSEPPMSNSP